MVMLGMNSTNSENFHQLYVELRDTVWDLGYPMDVNVAVELPKIIFSSGYMRP